MAMVSGVVKAVQDNRIALLITPEPPPEEGAEGGVEVRKKSAPKKKSAKKAGPEKGDLGKEEEGAEGGLKEAREGEEEVGDLHYYTLDMQVKVTINGLPYSANHLMEGDYVECLPRDERSNSFVQIVATRDEPFGNQAPEPEPPPGEEGGELPERPEEPIRPGGPPIAVPDSPEKAPDLPETAPDLPNEESGLIDVEVELEEEEEEEAGPDKPAGARRKTKRKR